MTRATTALLVASLCLACDGAPPPVDAAKQAEAAKAEEQAAADAKAAQAAKKAEDARKVEQQAQQEAYAAAKATLEPLAELPKKRPKGFAKACTEMLSEYDARMTKTLEGDALAAWTAGGRDNEFRVMRRACHLREVDAVVCETAVLKAAPPDADFAHIIRLCTEKFAG